MRKNLIMRKRHLIAIPVMLFSACFLAGCSNKIAMTTETYTLEAGTELPDSPETYASFANADLAAEASVRADQVDAGKVGTYEAAVMLNGKEYPFTVEVVDTTAPEGSIQNWFVLANEAVLPEAFAENFTDASETFTGFRNAELVKSQEELAAVFQEEGVLAEGMTPSELLGFSWDEEADTWEETDAGKEDLTENFEPEADGLYSLELVAVDVCGNASVARCYVLLDREAPVISGVEDLAVSLDRNTDMDALMGDIDGITVTDNLLGDITDFLEMDFETLQEDEEALQIKVIYASTDLCGNQTRAEQMLEMVPEKQTASGYAPTNMDNVLVTDGNVQNAALIYEGLSLIPTNILQKFLSGGWQILLTDKSMQDFGYTANVGGATYWSNHLIIISDTQGTWISNILVHEMGHVLGGYAGTPSSSAEFEAIYAEEKDAFAATGGSNGVNAYSSMEFFAQVFCDIYTTGYAKSVAPRAYEFVLRYVNSM